jgi:hypothetical protein
MIEAVVQAANVYVQYQLCNVYRRNHVTNQVIFYPAGVCIIASGGNNMCYPSGWYQC